MIFSWSSVTSRTTFAGAPRIRELSGNTFPSVTSAPAPTKQFLPITLSSDKQIRKGKMSVYRPKGAKPGKRGDPRFWPYGLNKVANPGDKLVIFVNNNLVIMIIVNPENIQDPKKIINKVNALLY